MPYLPYISDNDFIKHLNAIAEIGMIKSRDAKKNFYSNVIDPFGPIFEMGILGVNAGQWEKLEINRQVQKSIQNAVGKFHENILGSVPGWTKLKVGGIVDLVKDDNSVVAEIKNKYSSVSYGDRSDHYYRLSNQVNKKNMAYFGATAYFVQIIPNNADSFDRCFTPSDKSIGKKCQKDNRIREIDGRSFYALVTGIDDALDMLHDQIPKALIKSGAIANAISSNDLKVLSDYFKRAYF
jgi:hypothetical protein